MKRYQKVIFVGEDNLCESIMAEAIMRSIVDERPLEILSRGLVVLFPEPVNSKAVTILENNNLKAGKSYSQELKETDITEDTLILVMKEVQAQKVKNTYPDLCDVELLRTFAGYQGDMITPSGDLDNYQEVYEHIDLLVKAAARKIFGPIDQQTETEAEMEEEEIQKQVGDVIRQVFEETVEEGLREEVSQITEEQKLQHEKELEEEYLSIVQKTAEREAAREAAKESELSEYKILYQEIKEKNSRTDQSSEASDPETKEN